MLLRRQMEIGLPVFNIKLVSLINQVWCRFTYSRQIAPITRIKHSVCLLNSAASIRQQRCLFPLAGRVAKSSW